MKRTLIFVLAVCTILSAAFVPVDRARTVAENHYKNFAAPENAKNAIVNVIENSYKGEITWYGFEFDKGFVIVSADDGVRAILGYSYDGKIPSLDRVGGENFKEWFGYYDKQIKRAREIKYSDEAANKEWKDLENNIFPTASKGIMVDRLVDSKFDQMYPWNDDCPEKDGTFTYVGCVATAASMIMKYHRWPTTGDGTNSYSWNGQTLTENFSTHTFNYDLIKHDVVMEWGLFPTYWESIDWTQAEIDEMAELCYVVAQSFDMDFGTTADGGSGALMSTAAAAMNTFWRYVATTTNVGTPTNPNVQAANIQAQLDAKRPIWWAGGVHSFILDGYTTDYWYHINWGWNGYCDGWYQLTALIPADTGSGGGDSGDYTDGQIMITLVPDTNPYTTWPAPNSFTGNLVNGDDVQLTWTAPTGGTPTSYNVFKSSNGAEPVLLSNTTNLYYNDNDQIVGSYSYYVTAVYSNGESHHTSSYLIDVAASANFPVIRAFGVEPVGRTNIDLSWLAPFTGVINYTMDFEGNDGVFPTGWQQWLYDGSGSNHWTGDDAGGDFISITTKAVNPHIVLRPGDYALIVSSAHTYPAFFTTPEFTLSSDTFIKFWTRFKGNTAENAYPKFSVVTKTGLWSGRTYNVTKHATFSGDPADPDYTAWNDFESEWEVPITGFNGVAAYVGFEVWVTGNWYTMAFDDILVGKYSGGVAADPIGYDVYRNGSIAAEINNGTTCEWTDYDFADGDNTYYVRALYPTGESLASSWITVNIDANPNPDYLTGVLNGTDIDLSWYMPYGTPSHWATYIDPMNCTTTVDYLDDTDCAKRRAEFKAEKLGLYYPVLIDSIAGGFYEWADDPWGTSNTFVIRLWDGHPYDGTGTLLWQSGTLTATAGEVYKVGLPQTYTLNGPWNVEVQAMDATKGFPSTLAGPSTSGINCYFFYTLEDSYNYYVSSGADPLSYCLMAHVTGGDPDPIVKGAGWVGAEDLADKISMPDKRDRQIADLDVVSTKGINNYNIYRDGVVVGTSTTTTYTDAPSAEDTYEYYIKAAYVNPAGESAASNSINVYTPGTGGGPVTPSVPANLTTSVVSGNVYINWDDSQDATSYDVYTSVNPYGTFGLLTNVGTSEYTYTGTETKMFFYIKAKNSTKESPKTIFIQKAASHR
ncbi:MAG: C10 family peptidase [Candidatus Delongbacteria bacterium]|jgi:hypothetical protein|nr:C10 family peptidase [Candidatus Delongbacteria bacterium]